MSAEPDFTTTVYTGGTCLNNPGPGGYAAILIYQKEEFVFTGGEPQTTSIRMKMLGAIHALEELPADRPAIIHSNCELLTKGMTEYLRIWEAGGLRRIGKKALSNPDLWQRLIALAAGRSIIWTRDENQYGMRIRQRADAFAYGAAQQMAQSA